MTDRFYYDRDFKRRVREDAKSVTLVKSAAVKKMARKEKGLQYAGDAHNLLERHTVRLVRRSLELAEEGGYKRVHRFHVFRALMEYDVTREGRLNEPERP